MSQKWNADVDQEADLRLLQDEEALLEARPHWRRPVSTPARRPYRGRSYGRGYVPRTPRCYYCSRFGHLAPDCPQCAQSSTSTSAPAPAQPRDTVSRGRSYSRGRGQRPSNQDPQALRITLALLSTVPLHQMYDRRLLWALGSGAAIHATYRRELFTKFSENVSGLKEIISLSNDVVKVKGKGTVFIEELDTYIDNVYYVPDAEGNILSQALLCRVSKFQVHYLKNSTILVKNGAIVADAVMIGNVYYLKPKGTPEGESADRGEGPVATPGNLQANDQDDDEEEVSCETEDIDTPDTTDNNAVVTSSLAGKPLHSKCIHKWHRRLGHASWNVLKKMPQFAKGLDLKGCKVYLDCAVCKKAKSKAAATSKYAKCSSSRIFELVHTDIAGPYEKTFSGYKYFLTIVDDYSRYSFVYMMKEKSDTFQMFKDFAAFVTTQFNIRITKIQSDRGAEYMSQRFQDWMRRNGIKHQTSAPYMPAHNGIVERRQGVLQNTMHCLLEDANLRFRFWGEAIKYANYLVNRTWSSAIDDTPYNLLHGHQPDLKDLHTFGAYAMVNIPLAKRKKDGPVAKRMRFIGFDDNSKLYKFVDSNNACIILQSANFEEDADWSRIHSNDPGVFFPREDAVDTTEFDEQDSQTEVPSTSSSLSDVLSPDTTEAETEAEEGKDDEDDTGEEWVTLPRCSKRKTKGVVPKRYVQPIQYELKAPLPLIKNLTLPPDRFDQIKDLPESEQDKWYAAMQAEIDSLKRFKVFTPATPPENKKAIGTRWLYRIKKLPNGETLYKARLVAQGFAQKYPEDYTNTYSPTVCKESVKIALTTATILGLEVFQFDVENAYLHADLDEEIYVKGPPGFRRQEGNTWLLHKCLYGLKQSSLMWYLRVSKQLEAMGFMKSYTDECVFTKRSGNCYEILLLYVDDIVYIGPNKKMSEIFTKALQQHFMLKPLAYISTYLGVQIVKTKKGFCLSQEDKIDQLLYCCKMEDANPTTIPMQPDFYRLAREESPLLEDQTRYRSIIGSLQHLSGWTRPDIALSVSLLSRFQGKATEVHWLCIQKLLKYLKGTKSLKLFLEPTHTDKAELICFADADWAADKKSRKSTSGYIIFLNGCPVYWHVRKQDFRTSSSTEAEYACVSDACNSLLWFDALVTDIWTAPARPITIMEDNESVVYVFKTRAPDSRSKHIDVCCKNVRDYVKHGFVVLEYVPTEEQIADMLNKPIPTAQLEYLREKMCLA